MATLTAKDVSAACDELVRLQDRIRELERQLALYVGAIEYMNQYNGRTVRQCLALAAEDMKAA